LHNSQVALPKESIGSNVTYLYLPGRSYGERAGLAMHYLKSDFATILADDEIFVESGIDEMLKDLTSNHQLSSIGGKVLGIHRYGNRVVGGFAYKNMYEYQNFEVEVTERLSKHLVTPINGGLPRASMYRVMRSEVLKAILTLFSELSFVESPYIYEVAGEFAVAASGPTKTLKTLYWLRNWQNRMVQAKDWNRSSNFSEWWNDDGNLNERGRAIHLLADLARIKEYETQRILSQYIERRSLIELRANTEVSNLRVALSKLKQRVAPYFDISRGPIDISRVLDKEDLGKQNMDKSAIASLCRDFLYERGIAKQ
jgi:hypothetical protein